MQSRFIFGRSFRILYKKYVQKRHRVISVKIKPWMNMKVINFDVLDEIILSNRKINFNIQLYYKIMN